MGSLPVLKPTEVCRLLERLGFVAVRQRGSHVQYRHATQNTSLPSAATTASATCRASSRVKIPSMLSTWQNAAPFRP